MMKMLKTLHEQKMKSRRVQMRQRAQEHQKKISFLDNKRAQKEKEVKKEVFRVLGKIEKKKNKFRKD